MFTTSITSSYIDLCFQWFPSGHAQITLSKSGAFFFFFFFLVPAASPSSSSRPWKETPVSVLKDSVMHWGEVYFDNKFSAYLCIYAYYLYVSICSKHTNGNLHRLCLTILFISCICICLQPETTRKLGNNSSGGLENSSFYAAREPSDWDISFDEYLRISTVSHDATRCYMMLQGS